MATSPKRTLTTQEREARDQVYKVDVKEFSNILKGLGQVFNALQALAVALAGAGKGAYLAFPHPTQPGTFIYFTRKNLKSANAKFVETIKQLKHYLRVSRKKTRVATRPETLSGTFTPVYAGDALKTFFTMAPDRFGPLNPQTNPQGPSLMNSLALVGQGYLLRNTITILFYIYTYVNGLQDPNNAQYVTPDNVMSTAFNGNIPAVFYSYRNNPSDKNATKMLMQQAVDQRLIASPMNTFQVVAATNSGERVNKKGERVPPFNPAHFNTYFYQSIASLNYYPKAALNADPNLAPVVQAINGDDTRQAMLNEHNIAKQASVEWKNILEPGRKAQRDARKKVQDAAKRAARA